MVGLWVKRSERACLLSAWPAGGVDGAALACAALSDRQPGGKDVGPGIMPTSQSRCED